MNNVFITDKIPVSSRKINTTYRRDEMSTIYITTTVVQKTRGPVIGVYRERKTAIRRSAELYYYAVSDPTDSILSSATGMPSGQVDGCHFDDRDWVYPQLLEIVQGRTKAERLLA